MQIKDNMTLTWPGKLKGDPNKRSKDKYCRFHRDHSYRSRPSSDRESYNGSSAKKEQTQCKNRQVGRMENASSHL